MKTIEAFLSDLHRHSIKLWTEKGDLCYKAPKGAMTQSLRGELIKRKSEVLTFLISQMNRATCLPPIQPVPKNEELPLSYAQQRLWFLNELEDNSSATYNMPKALQLSGKLNIVALQQSLHWLQERHDSLRTYFPIHADKATVQIQAINKIEPLQIHDLCFLTNEEQAVQTRINGHAIAPFDLANGPLFKAELLQLSDEQSVLLLNMHHIVSDGWSIGIFIRDWQHAYTAFAQGEKPSLPSLAIQYSDYAAWQRNWLQGEVLQQQVDYWVKQLTGSPELLELPTDKPRPPQQSYQGTNYAHHLSATLSQSINELSQKQGVSVFMTLLASFSILLSRYSNQDDICIGSPIANRTLSQIEDLIGFFVNTLVLRNQLFNGNQSQSFIDLLLKTRQTCLDAYAHQDIPFEMLVEQLQPTRSLSYHPLFQVMFVLQNNELSQLQLPGLDIIPLDSEQPVAEFDLTLNMEEQNGQFECVWEYATDLFEARTIERMAGHFEVLLSAIVANPEQSISSLPMLTEKEIQQLQTWNETTKDYPIEQTIIDLFEQQVEKTPANIALVFEEQQLTYQQLNQKVNQLANYLLNLKTSHSSLLTFNFLVAIAVERCLEMVIGLLAVLKAGGAYVPIDPSYPPARIQYMLKDCAAKLLLTQSHLETQLPLAELECMVVCLDDAKFASQSVENPKINHHADDLAYIIYTSGTTGMPKGAMVEHRGMLNHIYAKIDDLKLSNTDVIAHTASLTFDISVWQAFTLLALGGRVQVFSEQDAKEPRAILDSVFSKGITILEIVPSLLRAILQEINISASHPNLSGLRWMVLTGEALPPDLCNEWFNQYPEIPLFNAYGPTECSDDVAHHPIYQAPALQLTQMPIGKPVNNMRLYVLDKHLQFLPVGIAGELFVAGIGVGRGYWNAPEKTAQAFIDNPFTPGERLYKTGDLVRWLPDGNLEYLGRIDHQIKLRGFRIELGEIESVLSQNPAVKEAVVVLYEADDNKRLVAYVTVESEKISDFSAELKDWLKAQLPEYMIPSHFIVLERLPLTPNGKIDRKALPAPEIEVSTGTKPKTPTEDLLAGLMAHVLKREAIDRDDNFFELGGHSLLATQLIARIRDSFQIELPVRSIFEYPQLANLATAIEAATDTFSLPAIEAQSEDAPKVLSYAQQRLWFLNQFEDKDSATYNMPATLQLSGQLDIAALQQSLFWLPERHTGLRTYFPTYDGKATVQVQPIDKIELLQIHDLRLLTNAEQSETIQSRINSHAITPFDLANGPLLKVELLQLNDEQSILLLNMHHIISDGWSIDIFIRDWQHAYTAFTQGTQPSKPPLLVQYSDYAAWQRNWLQGEVLQQQVDYWTKQLTGIPELLELPTDKPRPPQQSYQGAHYIHNLSITLSQSITELSRQQGVTVFMTLLASFNILLSRYSRQDDICVGSPIANRTHSQTEDIIGFFVNTLVLRSQLQPSLSVIDLLLQTRQTCLEAYAHQDIPFETLVEQLQPTRSLSHNPLFQVMFVLQNNETTELELPSLEITVLDSESHTAKFDLTLSMEEQNGQFECEWEYTTDLFEAETIERMAGHFEMLLTAIVENPALSISYLPILTEKEIQHLQAWNDTAVDYPKDKTIVDLFEEQVKKTPSNIAMIFEEQQLTYQQLNHKANQLAHHLLELKTDNCLIAIAMERCLEMVIGLLSILKTGSAYVPIDPSYPPARIRHMLDDSAAPLLLTQSHLKAQLFELEHECIVVCLDEVELAKRPIENQSVRSKASDLAYVIYTSGSTGKPKGVMIEHNGCVNHCCAMIRALSLSDSDTIAQTAPIGFDISVWQILTMLLIGGKINIIGNDIIRDPARFLKEIQTRKISVLQIVPSLLSIMLEISDSRTHALSSLRWLLVTGEAFPQNLLRRWIEVYPNIPLMNAYGPAECSDDVTLYSYYSSQSENLEESTEIFTEIESVVRSYCRKFPRVFTKSIGHEIFDASGNVYIDFLSGAGALNYGHNNPRLKQALLDYIQSDGVTHSLDMYTDAKGRFLESFNEIILKPRNLDYKVMFPGPTGTNTVEAALKLVRKVTGHQLILHCEKSFHGMTLGALSVSGGTNFRKRAGIPPAYTYSIPFVTEGSNPDQPMDALVSIIDSLEQKPAAIILETIQAEGGINVAEISWLIKLFNYAKQQNILTIVDDIQVGCGRTGSFFSFERAGLKPDLVCLSKSISGYGLPMSLLLIRPDIDLWEPAEHNGTFRGNNLAFVTATTALDEYWRTNEFERKIQAKAEILTRRLKQIITHYPSLNGIHRGLGAIQGIVCSPALIAGLISRIAFEKGLIVETAGHQDEVLKLLPPLTITEEFLEKGLNILEAAIAAALDTTHKQSISQSGLSFMKPDIADVSKELTVANKVNQQMSLTTVPIGCPIDNTRIYILDIHHNIVPLGIPGDLCIAGTGLARGYLNRPELTKEKFIEVELFGKTERIYKTGDLARWLPDGNLEYLGRIDTQIKLRGFRIELGEIEAVLSQHIAVKEAVVTLYEADDNKRLVAYFTTDSESLELVTELKNTLKDSLPDYMVPSHFTVLDKLPLTPNGKIDRKALPAPKIEISTGSKPKTLTEDLLSNLIAHILKRETINRDDNFFELGGHSLLATQLIARIRDSFQIELPVRAIFEYPQLSALATAIEAATDTVKLPAIEIQTADSPKILSYAQQRLWFLNQFEENNSATYNTPEALQLSGKLDMAALQQSLYWLQERHTSLRTYFPTHAGKATVQIQTIDKAEPLQIQDLRLLSDEKQNETVQTLTNSHAIASFDLDNGSLFKAELLQLNDTQSVLLINMHHIITDGWSMDVFIRDWQHAYTAFAQGEKPSLPSLTIQYSDYAAWQRNWLQGEVLQQQVDYWTKQLDDSPELLELSTDKPRPPHQSYQGAHYVHNLSVTLSQSITELSQQHGATVFMVLLAGFSILLSRYSRQDDICIGSPIANRTHSQTEDLIGFFVNTLVLRSHISTGKQSVIDLLLQTRQTCLEAYAHQDIPFEILVEQLHPTRSLSHHPLFQVMFVLQNNETVELKLPGLDIDILGSDSPVAKFDLTLNMEEQNGQFECEWEYATDLFEAKTIIRMAKHFEILLTAIVANPEQSISHLPMLTDAEIHQLQVWNDTATDYSTDQTIVDLFEQQAEKTPLNIAVVFEEQQLTYQQLNEKANQLAHHILTLKHQAKISSSNPLIAIVVERSMEMVIGLLGILKAGGAYVPIDPSYPMARIQYMLEDSAAPLLVTQSHLKAQLSLSESEHSCVVVCLDEADFVEQPFENPLLNIQPSDLAYVIYTSGSTGKPKGVEIEYAGLTNLIQAQVQAFGISWESRILQFASFSFDASVSEIATALTSGATLQLGSTGKFLPDEQFINLINRQSITHVTLPPPFLAALPQEKCLGLETMVVAGETCSPELITKWSSGRKFINAYGPTESTVCATMIECQANGNSPPIGKPIANTRIYILNAQHQLCPPCIPGELCIAGKGLARGYLNRSELTAEKFIEVELFGKTERIYKTGDLAQWLPDGNLEYLGRIDHQVKLRGFRIELGEIEAVISQHEAVKEAMVILYEADSNKRLVAYLTVTNEKFGDLAELKDGLKAQLPEYMIPSHFTVLDKLPLTPNGKIDRKALPEPDIEISSGIKPITPTEELLASLWAGILKRGTINRHDNFFELGGHSLLVTQLIARIRDSFQIELPVRTIFEYPQLSDLAIAVSVATSGVHLPPIEKQSIDEPKVLSFAQQRLWFLNQFEENDSATYNMPATLQLSGQLDIAALQQSLHWLQERHTSLRTYFPTHTGKATMQVLNIDKIEPLQIHDLRQMTDMEQNETVQNRVDRHAMTPFDLAKGPLFKAELLQLNDEKSVLLLNMHHIITDGWSMGVFIRDWQHAYAAFAQNAQPTYFPLTVQYSDYAAWQRNWLQGEVLQQQVDYWTKQLTGSPELLELPTDKPRPPQQSYQGAHYVHSLSPTLSQSVTELSQQHGVTVFMTLLTSFSILLARYSRQDDICVGSPIANRTHSQTEDLIGFFVNTLVLRTQLSTGEQSVIDLLLQTRQTGLEAYAHQDIPFEMLVEQLQPTRSLSYSPLFQVMFTLQNNEETQFELPRLDITPLESESPIAKFDLSLDMEEQNGQLQCEWEYATDLFEARTIERMARHFEVLLTAIVDNPQQSISHLPMLTEAEIRQLQTWNDTAIDYPKDKTIIDLFEQQVEKTPDNIAVIFEERKLTYRELNLQANQLAHYILELKTDNYLVAIAVERCLEMVIGILGILKTGSAYVPIDPSYPVSRISYMLEDSAAPLLLTQSHLKARLPALEAVVVCLDAVDFAKQPIESPSVDNQVSGLAYVIYTSGSTGKPKGVMIEQNGCVNHCCAMIRALSLSDSDTIAQTAPIGFDISVWQILTMLLIGGKINIIGNDIIRDPARFLTEIQTRNISVLQIVPSLLSIMLEISDSKTHALSALRWLLVTGEAFPQNLFRQWFEVYPNIPLMNAYGPAECSDDVTLYSYYSSQSENLEESTNIFTKNDDTSNQLTTANKLNQQMSLTTVPIGCPIDNTRIYILDIHHNIVPLGIPGDLCIAGTGLARGYLNRSELTTEKFIEVELFGKVERIYKTGDLARWLPGGNLEYLGRIDNQVKLRGFRIELGEIEAILSQHPAVKEAVSTLYEADDNKQLVAYVIVESEKPADSFFAELKDWLKARLPDYMVPSHFTVLEHLPLTPNGKIDRKALPAPNVFFTSKHYQIPRDQLELQLVQIWEKVLEIRPIGIRENFFEIGGHSLLAVSLMAQIEQQLEKHLPLAMLFQNATIEQLAIILRQQTETLPWSPLVAIQSKGEKPPFFCVHPTGGNVLCYYELAQMLGIEQPFYGLQAFGMEAGQVPYTQISEMAKFYLNAIQTKQPQGPYQLSGWSSGGLVAFEIARLLQTQGESVAVLALLDTIVPSSVEAYSKPKDNAQFLVDVFTDEGVSLSLEHLRQLTEEEQLIYVIELAKQANLFPPDMSTAQAKRFLQVLETNEAAERCHQLQFYHGKIILFQATEETEETEAEKNISIKAADYGWKEYTTEGVEIVKVQGNHHSMIESPHVETLAEQLKGYLK